jgi:glycosyltransferase involved in cell wall biosynthesis
MPDFFSTSGSLAVLESVYNCSLGRFTLEEAEKIIFMSCFQARKYLELGVEKGQVEVVYPSVDTCKVDRLNSQVRGGSFYAEKFGLKGNRVVLFVGRIERRKGLQYLVKAVPDIVKEVPDVKVVIAGPDAGYVGQLKQLVDAFGVRDYVFFAGVLSDLDVIKAIRDADVFVLPSESENFPEVILKAAYLKRPIVASCVGGVSEFVEDGENGFLIDVGDVEGIASAVLTLLGDEELERKFGEKAYRKVIRKHTVQQMAEQTIKIYKEILE